MQSDNSLQLMAMNDNYTGCSLNKDMLDIGIQYDQRSLIL